MKKFFVIFLLLPVCALLSQNLDDVLQKYYKAVNQEKLSKVQSVVMKVKLVQGGTEIPMTIYQERPHKVRTEGSFSGMTFIQTYDGTSGWSLNPFMGAAEPQPMKDEELKQAASQADIDGYLVSSKNKGYKLELLPAEDSVNVIKIVLPDSSVVVQYLDKNSGYMIKQKNKNTMQGQTVEMETLFSNYKTVKDIVLPFSMETKTGGQTMMKIVVEDVQFDQDIPDALFGKPEKVTK